MRPQLLILALVPLVPLAPWELAGASTASVFDGKLTIAQHPSQSTWRAAHKDESTITCITDSVSFDRPLCWKDIYDLEFTKVSSEIIPSLYETEVADDFVLPPQQSVVITLVRWWGGPYQYGGPDVTDFSLSLYESAGLLPADSPFWEIHGAQPASVFVGDDLHGSPTYEYELNVDIPIEVGINYRYWLSIQGEHTWPAPQWGRQGSDDFDSMFPYFRSEWFGNPDWEVLPLILEYKWEASFEIECHRVHGASSEKGLGFTTSLRVASPSPGYNPTSVFFDLREAGSVQLSVFDVSGRLVRVLSRESWPAGTNRIVWGHVDEMGRRVAPGVYFVQLIGRNLAQTRKITVLRP
jgi:hypothetical protein